MMPRNAADGPHQATHHDSRRNPNNIQWNTHTHTIWRPEAALSLQRATNTSFLRLLVAVLDGTQVELLSSSRHQCTPISHSPNDHPSIIYEYVGNFEAASTFLKQSSKLKKFFFCLVYFALHTAVVHLGVCLRSLLHCMLTTRRGEPAVETE